MGIFEEPIMDFAKDASKQADEYIAHFFGTSDLNEIRDKAQGYIFESVSPVAVHRESSLYEMEEKKELLFSITSHYRLRPKTQSEIMAEKTDEILKKHIPIGACIVCLKSIFHKDLDSSVETMHGWYHHDCLDGRPD